MVGEVQEYEYNTIAYPGYMDLLGRASQWQDWQVFWSRESRSEIVAVIILELLKVAYNSLTNGGTIGPFIPALNKYLS